MKDKSDNEERNEMGSTKVPPVPDLKAQDEVSDRTDDSKRNGQQQAHLHVTTGPKKRKQPKAIENDTEPDAPVPKTKTPPPSKVVSDSKNKSKRRKVKLSFDNPTD